MLMPNLMCPRWKMVLSVQAEAGGLGHGLPLPVLTAAGRRLRRLLLRVPPGLARGPHSVTPHQIEPCNHNYMANCI